MPSKSSQTMKQSSLSSTTTITKKRRASSSSSQPAAKKARVEEEMSKKSKKGKKVKKSKKAKKGPACETCRKKKIKCAHRLELVSVTNTPSATDPSSSSTTTTANQSSSSAAAAPPKAAEASKLEPLASPAKLDEEGNATEAVRRRIWADRQKYTIQFTEEDWHREPVWASRVFGGFEGAEERLLPPSSSRV
ncbi:hypothetical protein VTL71DRAFT_13356 [Oculimacula yallundae]|uniref:Zn(2)-C6 fungal-type domain-containing protein n=1 Tax=Oculimacula yallundae TaxID=86028 RepID=A0ABR4CKM4_9HELO